MGVPEALIEFRYRDGRVGTKDLTLNMHWAPRRGDHLEYDGGEWLVYDREDRGGVTVYLCKPADQSVDETRAARA
jgi:hypothetical protein